MSVSPAPENATIGDLYRPAMRITKQNEASEYLEMLVCRRMQLSGKTREDAMRCEKSNLGYFAGYYDAETMARVNQLFETEHPVFGVSYPDPQSALESGECQGSRS